MKAVRSLGAGRMGTGTEGEARGPGLTATELEASGGRGMEEVRTKVLGCPWVAEPGARRGTASLLLLPTARAPCSELHLRPVEEFDFRKR